MGHRPLDECWAAAGRANSMIVNTIGYLTGRVAKNRAVIALTAFAAGAVAAHMSDAIAALAKAGASGLFWLGAFVMIGGQ